MRIGELAKESGVSPDALRYYERAGLLGPVARGENRYRQYPQETVGRLEFIRKMQSLGFTLASIRDLLELIGPTQPTCRRVGPNVRRKMRELDRQIAALTDIRRELDVFFGECREGKHRRICVPIARLLSNEASARP